MEIPKEKLLEIYERMATIRQFEERVREEFAANRIPGFVHLYAGEEAVAVGVCAHLTDEDIITSTHRGHGHCIAKGVDVKAMMAELYGRATGACKGKGGSMPHRRSRPRHAWRQRHCWRGNSAGVRCGSQCPSAWDSERCCQLFR